MIGVSDHPWLGGLFGDAEAAAIWSPQRQLEHMIAFEAAYTRALGQVGLVPEDVAKDVAQRIAAFRPDLDDLRAGTARDGLPVPALVAQLKTMADVPPKAVHAGATSQDVIDTALTLTLAEFNPLVQARLEALKAAIADLSQRFGTNPLMGRTRMQAALEITAADRLRTWAQPLEAHLAQLEHMRPRVEILQFGGAVGNRAAVHPHGAAMAADMAARLGLGDSGTVWHTAREGLVDYAGLLSSISGSLGKMGQDICLMAQQGVDDFAQQGGGGSSAMPHKQNPILAETLVTLARFNATQIGAMHHALVHEQERSGVAWALEWMILPQMAMATARGLGVAQTLCSVTSRIGRAGES
ncbi:MULTISPECIES: 3-carboxy-cis,cis-muconate cycloisomerase [unclassified Marinovum]